MALLLRIDPVVLTSDPDEVEEARTLLREYAAFTQSLAAPGFRQMRLEREIAELPHSYGEAGSELLVAYAGEVAAGCVAYRPLAEVRQEVPCELKRMWVRPEYRGLGVGEALVEALFKQAKGNGYAAVYLDTEPQTMPAAYRLYLRLGFAPCEPYRDASPGLRFLRRELR